MCACSSEAAVVVRERRVFIPLELWGVQSVLNMSSSKRRKCLNSQTRETVAKLYDFLKNDAREILTLIRNPAFNTNPVLISNLDDHLNRVLNRTARAVGIGERTVSRILAEREKHGSFKTPYKDRKKRAKKLELNDSNIKIIRTAIESYQLEHQKLPSLSKLKIMCQEKLNFDGCVTTLRKALSELGYKWK